MPLASLQNIFSEVTPDESGNSGDENSHSLNLFTSKSEPLSRARWVLYHNIPINRIRITRETNGHLRREAGKLWWH